MFPRLRLGNFFKKCLLSKNSSGKNSITREIISKNQTIKNILSQMIKTKYCWEPTLDSPLDVILSTILRECEKQKCVPALGMMWQIAILTFSI